MVVVFQPAEHLFKQDPLVCRVLVKQHQATVGFEDNIKSADDADQPERDVKEGDWLGGRGVNVGRCRGCRSGMS